ncbi:MAG: ABC transporter ATP-binding protein/permease [Alphaproteobacteria bacterium]|nr:ABC transporter ATP-binding protein/permease [Alphaproteobacteria bacterium]
MNLRKNPFIDLTTLSWRYAEGQRGKFVLFYSLSILANFVLLLLPVVLGQIFTVLQEGGPDVKENLAIWTFAYALIIVGYWAFHGPSRHMERQLAFKIREHYITEKYNLVMSLPAKWHQENHTGETLNRIIKSADSLYDFSQTQFNYIMYIITFFVPIIALAFVSFWVAFVAFISCWLAVAVIWHFDKALVTLLDEENNLVHRFTGVITDYINNATTILSLKIVGRSNDEIRRAFSKIKPVLFQSIHINESKWFSLALCRTIIEIMILFLFLMLESRENSAALVGTSVMVYQYLRRLSDTAVGFADSYERIIRWRSGCQSIAPLQAAYDNMPKPEPLRPIEKDWQLIKVRDVEFYQENRDFHKPVHILKHVDIDIHAGQKIALVGESGAGKSSLLGILAGLYESQGTVEIDGTEPRNIIQMSQLVTLIPQDPEIFANTIRYNVATGLMHDDEKLIEAVRMVNFEAIASRYPKFLDTDIRERGVNLSGGEKQRLALARGVFIGLDTNSSIMLLDEPTSSVDSATEREIYEQLFAGFKDRAIISSVHRLHLLELFDWVYVMEDGKIVEQGTFNELIDHEGELHRMWKFYNRKNEII